MCFFLAMKEGGKAEVAEGDKFGEGDILLGCGERWQGGCEGPCRRLSRQDAGIENLYSTSLINTLSNE